MSKSTIWQPTAEIRKIQTFKRQQYIVAQKTATKKNLIDEQGSTLDQL